MVSYDNAFFFLPITGIQQLGGHVFGVSFLAIFSWANVCSHAEVADLHYAFVGRLIVRGEMSVVGLIQCVKCIGCIDVSRDYISYHTFLSYQ